MSVCGYHIDHLYEPEKYPLRWIDPPIEGEGEGGEGGTEMLDMGLNPLRGGGGGGGGSARVVSSTDSANSAKTITSWT